MLPYATQYFANAAHMHGFACKYTITSLSSRQATFLPSCWRREPLLGGNQSPNVWVFLCQYGADCQAAKYLSRKRLACIEVGHSKQVRCNVCSVLEVGACIGVTSSLLSRIFQGAAWAQWCAILMIGLVPRGSKSLQDLAGTPNISPKKSAYRKHLHLKLEYLLYTLPEYQVAFYYKF